MSRLDKRKTTEDRCERVKLDGTVCTRKYKTIITPDKVAVKVCQKCAKWAKKHASIL